MYLFQKNRLFEGWLLNTVMLSVDKPPLKDIIYLDFLELLSEKPAK